MSAIPLLVALSAWASAAAPGRVEAARQDPPPGYRGFALALPWEQLAFLKKGDRVDVMSTFDELAGDSKPRRRKITGRLLDNMLILDLWKPRSAGEKGSVELALTPLESQYLSAALQRGAINLARRKTGDVEMPPLPFAAEQGACADWIAADRDESLCGDRRRDKPVVYERPAGNELHDGFRAVSLPLPSERARYLRSGDRVDVIAAFPPLNGKPEERVAATPLQSVLVVGTAVDAAAGRAAVELELNPHEAEYIALFQHLGSVELTRRPASERELYPISWARFDRWWRGDK